MENKYIEPPLVSILVALYNAGENLDIFLTSLLETSYKNIEIIILDDFSDDRTEAICLSYSKKDPRVKYFKNETNLGIFPTYKRLSELANGKYLVWNDQDDYRDASFVAKAVLFMEKNPGYSLCHCITLVSIENLNVHGTTIESVAGDKSVRKRTFGLLRNFSDITIYGLISRQAFDLTSGWQFKLSSSNLLLFELLLIGKFHQIPEQLFYYTGKGVDKRPKPLAEFNRSVRNHRKKILINPGLRLLLNQVKSTMRLYPLNKSKTLVVLAVLLGNFILSTSGKVIYRAVLYIHPIFARKKLRGVLGKLITRDEEIVRIVDPDNFPQYYSKDYPLK